MFLENYNKDEYSDEYIDDSAIDHRDYANVSLKSIRLALALQNCIQTIINTEESKILNEKFTSEGSVLYHYNRHCLNDVKFRKSRKNWIYYDFNSTNDFIAREDFLDKRIKASKYNINDLADSDLIIKYFRKLFEGNQTLNFNVTCGFTNELGRVSISFNSWANSATTNYANNTVDFIVRSPDNKTITMYALDASFVERRFNSELVSCGFEPIKINR